jgi:4-oxalocrotonate tautomerase family enzyme
MPIVTVKLMEGVLSDDQKKSLMKGLADAVVNVYGAPMRLFMHVVLEEVRTGDWIAGGGVVTSERVNAISPNVRRANRGVTSKAAARKRPGRARK